MTSPEEPLHSSNLYNEYCTAAEHATERVAMLINDNYECTNLFCQMDMLRQYKNDLVWKEMARWIRYEEAVEEGGQRWSKPHVASLMMEALQDLQNILTTCPVILDSKSKSMADIASEVTNAWTKEREIMAILKNKIVSILLKPHKFQHYVKRNEMKKKTASSNNIQKMHEAYINKAYDKSPDTLAVPNSLNLSHVESCPDSPSLALGEKNKSFMRKIPPGSEVVNLLVGEVEELDRIVAAFVRLKTACNLGDITEVELNTKFLFIILGPKTHLGHCAEMCRCMATLFTDEIFRCVAYRAEDRIDVLCGIQEFALHLTVLPPGVWDPSTRIEPPDELPSQDYRKSPAMVYNKSAISLSELEAKALENGHIEEEEGHSDPTLVRTGKLFGGLIQDIKRKAPWYPSDLKDALHIQCVATFFYLFLATLTPNVTFGGLLGIATEQYMGTMECILAAAISGILFALCSGQPLNILGSTGPMLVLEGILFRFCKDQDWDFFPFRVWVGFWTGLFIFLIVAFDLSALVRYITRFTEESFACLIALIFIFEAFKKTFDISHEAPVHLNPPLNTQGCFCLLNHSDVDSVVKTTPFLLHNASTSLTNVSRISSTISTVLNTSTTSLVGNITNVTAHAHENTTTTHSPVTGFAGECLALGGAVSGVCKEDKYVPDVFFFSLVLFFGTFFLSISLVRFRHSLFFPTFVRQNVSDFAVLLSIIIMVVLDAVCGLPTPKLIVPTQFKPSVTRPWLISPWSDKNPWWLILLSCLPALLATILIFMDQQITAVIVNRRENKLKKGSGYHLDMLVVGILVVVHGLLGLPWYVAATVTALAHIMSLRKVSECTAPGEKPTFLGVREQRVTAFLVGVFSGLAVLITSVLRHIPMPVLYGVFLYMGIAPLGGMQLIQRILLVFMPAKYQPEYSYIRNVPIKRVHLFTLIQVVCLVALWVVKSIKSISIAFPLMVLILCFVRKALDKIFTQRELKWLDDILPATQAKPMEQEEEKTTEPVLIKITHEEEKPTDEVRKVPIGRTLSAPEKETAPENGEIPSREQLKPRTSLTFVCKTDIDRIKAMTPEVVTNRRQSLAMANERKKSIHDIHGPPGADRRKFSSPLMLARKLSVEAYASPFGNIPTIEEHNKLNRMLSLPATIEDEGTGSEENSDSDSEKKKYS